MPESRALTSTDFANAEEHVLGQPAEHIYLEDELGADAAHQPKTVAEKLVLNDGLRRRSTEMTLYAEGFLELVESRAGKRSKPRVLNLRYLDPVPSIERHYPLRLIKIAAGSAAAAAVAALLAQVDALAAAAYPAAALAGAGALAAIVAFIYASHEKVVYRTLHGRAAALTLRAGLGYMHRFRAAMPRLIRAIEQAEESIGDDTAIYLRAEMREHYRLRSDGVLTEQDCSEGTGRILLHFDDEM